MNNTNKQRRQRYTRRHKNSPNYARGFNIVDGASGITFGLGMILFIIGLGFLGGSAKLANAGSIMGNVGLGVGIISLTLSLVLIGIDDEYESEQQANMIKGMSEITPEEGQNIGNHMANMARMYQESKKIDKNDNSSKND